MSTMMEITEEDKQLIDEYYRKFSTRTKDLENIYDSVAPIYDRVISLLGHGMCAKKIAIY